MRKTIRDLFKFYKYPCQELYGDVVPNPYIKKENVNCSHPASLTYHEWKQYIKLYLKYFKMYLLSGRKIKLPYKLGYIQLQKVKGGGANYTEDQLSFYKNSHTGGYRPFFRWIRDEAILKEKSMWAMRPTVGPNGYWRKISKALFKDPTLIYNYKTHY